MDSNIVITELTATSLRLSLIEDNTSDKTTKDIAAQTQKAIGNIIQQITMMLGSKDGK